MTPLRPIPYLRLRVTLEHVRPEVWRQIEVPADVSFWELHVAIQDAMGWQDCHLHDFRRHGRGGPASVRFGIAEQGFDEGIEAGWRFKIAVWLEQVGDRCMYFYDFGDDWTHVVEVEAVLPGKAGGPKARGVGGHAPRCVGGSGICPPENCGGPPGFEEWLRKHPEIVAAKHVFDPETVEFSDPAKRLERLLG